jgi:hypothetical protein
MRFVSLKTLSKDHDLSISQLRKFLKQGMPYYRPQKKILVDPEEFERWFSARFRAKSHTTRDRLDAIVSKILDKD